MKKLVVSIRKLFNYIFNKIKNKILLKHIISFLVFIFSIEIYSQDYQQIENFTLVPHKLINKRIDLLISKSGASLQIDSVVAICVNDSKSRRTYTYDTNGLIGAYTFFEWYNKKWNPLYRISYNYNPLGDLLLSLEEKNINNTWYFSNKISYFYGSDENLSFFLIEFWNNDHWLKSKRYNYTYDSLNRIKEIFVEAWSNEFWLPFCKYSYIYNTIGNLDLTYEVWKYDRWEDKTKGVYEYNDEGKLISFVFEIWDGNNWHYSSAGDFEYDVKGNRTIANIGTWDGSKWDMETRFLYEYNSEDYCIYSTCETWNNGLWWPADNDIHIENPGGQIITEYGNEIFIYYKNATNIKGLIDLNTIGNYLFQNYPNPFNSTTVISYFIPHDGVVNLIVYDILGNQIAELVKENQTKGYYSINFTNEELASGLYIYTIYVNDFAQSRSMVIIK